jgi:hypothetical protein
MGYRFYEATMPKIAEQLERLNTNIEALVAELRRLSAQLRDQAPPAQGAHPAANE